MLEPTVRAVPQVALDLIKHYEGFSAKPYLCPAGIPTIGYGSTYYRNGKPVTMKDPAISRIDASVLLLVCAFQYQKKVLQMVKVPLKDNQLAALVSFAYNLGTGRLKASTLLRKLNRGDYVGAANEFPKWCFAGKKKLKGLELRRQSERQLFLRG